MKEIIFESSPGYILLCLLLAIGLAALLYRAKNPWGQLLNRLLLVFRTILIFLLAFFLLGPIVKQVKNVFDKPVIAILQDNSLSVKETTDTSALTGLLTNLSNIGNQLGERGFEVSYFNYAGEGITRNFTEPVTNMHEALRGLSARYEGRSLAGVIMVSDGIYNAGLSPLYGHYNFPVYALGVGDTTVRSDVAVKSIVYNKIAYMGNKFPVRAEVMVKGYTGESIQVSLWHKGKVVERKSMTAQADLLTFDFQGEANEQGIQRWDVVVDEKPGEYNVKNNRATIFIDVVEGRKKILLVASAPHPDIKAIRAVIEQNANFEFLLHIPLVAEAEQRHLQPENIDLVLFHAVPDVRGRTREIFQRFAKNRTPIFLTVSATTDLSELTAQNMPVGYENITRQFDDVTPVVNPVFSNFSVSPEAVSAFAGFPPVQVHFGKLVIQGSASVLLNQKVGSLATEKPLLYVVIDDTRKVGVLLGEGLWRWRLHEFSRTENTTGFDEVVGKLLQYLSTSDDKSKFRCTTVRQQFTDTEPVLFESQVYNDIFEPVYGNTIDLELTHEQGQKSSYSYITSPGNTYYPVGGLKEGVYRYRASTQLNGQREEVRGQFLVVAQQLELQNLTADFDMLRKLATQTGGKFYKTTELGSLRDDLTRLEARNVIHSEERYDMLINLKWIFFLLLALAGVEWFLRKYYGSY